MKAFPNKTVQGDLEEMTSSLKWIAGKTIRVTKKEKVEQMKETYLKETEGSK